MSYNYRCQYYDICVNQSINVRSYNIDLVPIHFASRKCVRRNLATILFRKIISCYSCDICEGPNPVSFSFIIVANFSSPT